MIDSALVKAGTALQNFLLDTKWPTVHTQDLAFSAYRNLVTVERNNDFSSQELSDMEFELLQLANSLK